ncbi:MAG TPA: hypothetical protein VFM21_11775, partial [Terriglobia bacterium]|nr:hypothetical protein [Terriglobia bacterium]
TDRTGKPADAASLAGFKMITSDFASSWLYFSPADQSANRFRYFGTQSIQNDECYVVGFAQIPELARSVSGYRVGDQASVLLVQGLAWIDKRTFHIPRIATWLLAPRRDIGLEGENSIVNYFPVKPEGVDKPLWVPHDVIVTIFSQGLFVRNTHRYSNFKLFRVESTIKPVE